ncbi:transforming acidic coiled-coil-containing protein 2 isoform X2 [Xenopus laevis]|uniref:Transforming acidic coiled-coil-containing protein 2 isoform X2 n=1 Tax=Xenopus laevis TaxID=8355 RepID=A0A8J1LCW7_XENLA|nr:transforming acidic coiled-coil-containing protein 2 isoform X2 [Xenopus laevis]
MENITNEVKATSIEKYKNEELQIPKQSIKEDKRLSFTDFGTKEIEATTDHKTVEWTLIDHDCNKKSSSCLSTKGKGHASSEPFTKEIEPTIEEPAFKDQGPSSIDNVSKQKKVASNESEHVSTECETKEKKLDFMVLSPSSLSESTQVPSSGHLNASPIHDKLVSPHIDTASTNTVTRSPTFPMPDSYSFTQKLRSVLHSDKTFTRKSATPEPLVLPSSPRLVAEGTFTQRSSDSEEAFETPESTTPVKSASPVSFPPQSEEQEQQQEPPPSPPPPVQQVENEITPQPLLLPEDTDSVFAADDISVDDEPGLIEQVNQSPFRAPSGSFSVVFDEDKPIASSGAYNLDFTAAEPDDISTSSDVPVRSRRKSSDSVPSGRNTLSRSLSLQAADFQAEEGFGNQGGSDSACSSLRRSKKVRPGSLKKKTSSTKKQIEPAGSKDTKEEVAGDSQETDLDKNTQILSSDSPTPPVSNPDLELVGPQQISALESSDIPNVSDQECSVRGGSVSDSCALKETVTASPSLDQGPEVPSSETERPEATGIIGQSVRLEFDYSEEACEGQPPSRKGKKPSGKMPLRKPKPKKAVEKPDAPPGSPTPISVDSDEIPIGRGSYTYNLDKWDDPNFDPFSSGVKIQDPPPTIKDPPEAIKQITHRSESPAKTPASFEIPAGGAEQNTGESNKPAKKKKTPLKTDTFRVKKSPKRSPVHENGTEELTLLPKSDIPPMITSEDHATDEEKLASSVGQKWSCMAVDLEPEKKDYPEPSDLSNFVNENQFHSSTADETEFGKSYNIEYMEKTGSCSPLQDVPQTQSLYLIFEGSQESPGKTPSKFSETSTPGTGSTFDGLEPPLCTRSPPIMQDSIRQPLERPRQRDEENGGLGCGKMELGSPEDAYVAAETLLSRISQQAALCDQLSYLEPDLAEKNPQAFAQKLQEELEFAAMRIEALTLAKHISQVSLSSQHPECVGIDPTDVVLSHNSLYSRTVPMETGSSALLHPYQQSDVDTALQIAREEIAAKEMEVSDWKKKYEECHCEVVEMRKIVAEYEKTIAQMIEDEQREKSMSHHTVQQLILEKEQALSDLNSVEKSLADLFRRYEKMKEVLEGFRKNEEVLKRCAQEYLARVKKEEQRYHALKIHAEEKLDRANAEIAQLRSKSQQEQVAHQASLRKEQLRVDALERTLEQKNREVEELTKICDELIAKMGRS